MLIAQYTVLSSILPGHRNWMEVMGVILVLAGSGASSVFAMFKTKKQDNDHQRIPMCLETKSDKIKSVSSVS